MTAAKDYDLTIPTVKPLVIRVPVHRFLSETINQRYVLLTTGYSAPAYTTLKVQGNNCTAGDVVARVNVSWFVQFSHRVR